jgi:hypothetical protein
MAYDPKAMQELREAAALAFHQFGSFDGQALAYLTKIGHELGLDDAAVMNAITGAGEVADSPPALAPMRRNPGPVDSNQPPLLRPRDQVNGGPPVLSPSSEDNSPPPLVSQRSAGKPPEELAPADELFREFARAQLDAGKSTREEMQAILGHGRLSLKISTAYARHLLEDVAAETSVEVVIPGSRVVAKASTVVEPRVREFVDRARGHIGVEGGINVKSRMLIDREAEDLGLSVTEREAGMEMLTSAVQTSTARDSERAAEFQSDLEIQLQDLSGVVAVARHESLHRSAMDCYGLAAETAKRVIKEQAERYGLKVFSREHVTGLLTQMCETLVGESTTVDRESIVNLREQAQKLGLSAADCDSVMTGRLHEQDRIIRKENALSRRLVSVTIALSLAVAMGLAGISLMNQGEPVAEQQAANGLMSEQEGDVEASLAVPEWWSEETAIWAARIRVKVPELVSALDRIQLGGTSERVTAYIEMVDVIGRYFRGQISGVSVRFDKLPREVRSVEGSWVSDQQPYHLVSYQAPLIAEKWLTVSDRAREAGELVGQILAEFYAHDPEEEAIEQIRKSLLEFMAVKKSLNAYDYHLAIWSAQTALKAHGMNAAPELRKKEMRQEIGAVLGEPVYATEQSDVESETWQRVTAHLLKNLAAAEAMSVVNVAASYQFVVRTGSATTESSQLSELKLDAICAVLPTAGEMSEIYLMDLELITRAADIVALNRILELFQRVRDEEVRRRIANFLLARIGEPLDSVADGAELAQLVRKKMAAAARANPRQDNWAQQSDELIALVPDGEDSEEAMLEEILELAHRGVQGCALYKKAAGISRFDRLENDGPPVPKATPGPATGSSASSGFGSGGLIRSGGRSFSADKLIEWLNDGQKKTQHFDIYTKLAQGIKPEDITSRQGGILAKYITALKKTDERESVNGTLGELGISGYLVVAVADRLANANSSRLKQKYIIEIVSALVDREVKIEGLNWRLKARIELMRSALPRFNVAAEEDTGELIDSAAQALSQLYLYHAELHGVSGMGGAEGLLPGDVLFSAVRHLAKKLKEEELSESLQKKLERASLELDVVDFVAIQDLQRIVVLQRTYLKLLAILVEQGNPDLGDHTRQFIDELYRKDRSSRHVLAQIRNGEAALIRMWNQVLLRGTAPGDTVAAEERDLESTVETSANVSEARLSSLKADNPLGYRDYAEELAEKREDPLAIAMSIRLYLIAAYLDQQGEPTLNQGNLARSCFLGMRRLARNLQEEKIFVSMARLMGDRQPLKTGASQLRNVESSVERKLTADFRKALKSLRARYDYKLSRTQKNSLKTYLKPYANVFSHEDLLEAIDNAENSSSDQPAEMVHKILKMELSLLERELQKNEQSAPRQSQSPDQKKSPWSQLLLRKEINPLSPLSIRYATEFDAAKCLFRGDRWVAP